jgi:hypothetical protein
MKKIILTSSLILSLGFMSFGQSKDELDTAKLNLGKKIVKIYTKNNEVTQITFDSKDTTATKKKTDEECKECKEKNKYRGHFQGLDFGFTTLLNSNGGTKFINDSYLENDPAKSFYFNFNLFDTKLPIFKEYVGITTGLGFNWTQIGIKNNQTLKFNNDSLFTITSTSTESFSTNKLKGLYLQVPLLLEFNTNLDPNKSAYLALGVLGGFKINSKLVQRIDTDHQESDQKFKGDYALNSFKLDATVRFGYAGIGFFANYALTPLFDVKKTSTALPLTFGLSWNWN